MLWEADVAGRGGPGQLLLPEWGLRPITPRLLVNQDIWAGGKGKGRWLHEVWPLLVGSYLWHDLSSPEESNSVLSVV